jgi:hypothetical protein
MSNTPWVPFIRKIQNANPVDQDYTNIHIDQIVRRTDYLKEQLDSLNPNAGRVVAKSVSLEASVALGSVVYWDANNTRFDLALAEGYQDPVTGIFYASPRAFAIGIVVYKSGPTLGDVLIFGKYNFEASGIPLSSMLENPSANPFSTGRFYLSRQAPGKITSIPSAPLVQIGFFTVGDCFIYPLQKDLFESHYHYMFNLVAKPAASQNFARTGYSAFGTVVPTQKWWVDYFNNGVASPVPPPFLVCIRKGSGVALPGTGRVDLFRDGANQLGIRVTQGAGLDYEVPSSLGATTTVSSVAWPAYGEWVSIPGTDLDVAFVRQDRTYVNTLDVDANAALTISSDQYKIFLPNDYSGWTNANPFDIGAPASAWFQYVLGGDSNLTQVWPPVPNESALVEQNGVSLVPSVDYLVNNSGIFWYPQGISAPLTFTPWPIDYNSQNPPIGIPPMDFQLYGKTIRLFFSRTIFANSDSIVRSLKSLSPALTITRCPSGEAANTGDLQADLDLSLVVDSEEDSTSLNPFAFTRVDGISLKPGKVVRRIKSGLGITISSDTPGDSGVGEVTVSTLPVDAQGEFQSVALLNAKEVIHNNFVFFELLPAATARTAFVGKFTIPNIVFPSAIKINMRGLVAGTDATDVNQPRIAIVRVMVHVIRPGVPIPQMTEGVGLSDNNSLMVRFWQIIIPGGYQPLTILDEVPVDPVGSPGFYQINQANQNTNSYLLSMSPTWLQPLDRLSVKFERVAVDPYTNTSDDYSGKIAFSNLRWYVEP